MTGDWLISIIVSDTRWTSSGIVLVNIVGSILSRTCQCQLLLISLHFLWDICKFWTLSFRNVLSIKSQESHNFLHARQDQTCCIVLGMDAGENDVESYPVPIYGTLSRLDKLQLKSCSSLLTHVSIPAETDQTTLTKMAVALVINEESWIRTRLN